jgi:hypothetical protein
MARALSRPLNNNCVWLIYAPTRFGSAPPLLRLTTDSSTAVKDISEKVNVHFQRLGGTRSNRDGIGTQISVTTPNGNRQSYSVSTAVEYFSASDRRAIVSLGIATTAKSVAIRWPDGRPQKLSNIRSDQMLNITEPRR